MRQLLLVAVVITVAAGCESEITIDGGTYRIDTLNEDEALAGVKLRVEPTRAVLIDGEQEVEFALRRLPTEQWQRGCMDMISGSRLETFAISPQRFEVRGQSFEADFLTADCGQRYISFFASQGPNTGRVLRFQ